MTIEPMTIEPLTSHALSCPHGFFTRRGGVSAGPYASLNCSLSGQDAPEAVRENRALVARHLGAEPPGLVGVTQVHGVEVAVVEAPWSYGAGPRADAMVTNRRGIALGIVTADCAPVLMADLRAGVVGAVHAGWRGAVAGVLEAAADAMVRLGARPESIAAAIGPCIRQPSYEVGPDLRDAVLAHDVHSASFFMDGARLDRWQFDLAGYCRTRLRDFAQVDVIDADTLADAGRFFSHRRRTPRRRRADWAPDLGDHAIGRPWDPIFSISS